MVRVLLVDDHDLVRAGLRRVLEDERDMEVVGDARTGEEAIERSRALQPEVILMDLNMPGIGGLEATRRIVNNAPVTRVIGISVHTDGTFPRRLLEAGAYGYLTKGSSMDEVLDAIRSVNRGRRYISRDTAQKLALDSVMAHGSPLDELSDRELQVLRMIAQGCAVQTIAKVLHLSEKTVSTYKARLHAKCNVESTVELAYFALRHGLIESGEECG